LFPAKTLFFSVRHSSGVFEIIKQTTVSWKNERDEEIITFKDLPEGVYFAYGVGFYLKLASNSITSLGSAVNLLTGQVCNVYPENETRPISKINFTYSFQQEESK